MKKSRLLMLLPAALLLVGCAESLTPEEATAKAAAISEAYAGEEESLHQFKVVSKMSETANGKTQSSNTTIELDLEKVYAHSVGEGSETWAYKNEEDGKYYVAVNMETGKTYSVYEKDSIEYAWGFEISYEMSVAMSKGIADVIGAANLTALIQQYQAQYGEMKGIKYSSSGDGQLEFTAELDTSDLKNSLVGEEEVDVFGKGTFTIVWENNRPSEISASIKGVDAKGNSASMEMNLEFSYSISVIYPDLAGYTEE